jgi:hypothetical protein
MTTDYPVEDFTVDTATVTIFYDDDPESPRDYWCNLGVMLCSHSRYTLGDDRLPNHIDTMEELRDWVTRTYNPTVILPLYLLDHSGLSMRAGSPSPFDPGGWDTSLVGVIFDTEATREECGTSPEFIEECLRGEVDTYSRYLEGQVFGYVVETPDGDQDSCWGFFDIDHVREEATAVAEAMSVAYTERERVRQREEAVSYYDRLATYAFAG